MGNDAYSPARIIAAARQHLADALSCCAAGDRQSPQKVHEVRKDLKKVRAYWRLMWYALGRGQVKAGDARCRHAAKVLAGARDQTVMLGTLEELGQETGVKTSQALNVAKQAVHEASDTTAGQAIDWSKVVALIGEDDAAWSVVDASAIDPADIRRGWKRTRRKARASFMLSRQSLDAEVLHAWRKWSKRWLEQEELLHPEHTQRISLLDELGQVLGRHHDLAVLSRRLRRSESFGGKPQRRVRKSIGKRQAGLEKHAIRLGAKAYE